MRIRYAYENEDMYHAEAEASADGRELDVQPVFDGAAVGKRHSTATRLIPVTHLDEARRSELHRNAFLQRVQHLLAATK